MSAKRWFHVVSNTACWGFAINEESVVVDVDYPAAKKVIYKKSVKDPSIRRWFIENNLIVTEIKDLKNKT